MYWCMCGACAWPSLGWTRRLELTSAWIAGLIAPRTGTLLNMHLLIPHHASWRDAPTPMPVACCAGVSRNTSPVTRHPSHAKCDTACEWTSSVPIADMHVSSSSYDMYLPPNMTSSVPIADMGKFQEVLMRRASQGASPLRDPYLDSDDLHR